MASVLSPNGEDSKSTSPTSASSDDFTLSTAASSVPTRPPRAPSPRAPDRPVFDGRQQSTNSTSDPPSLSPTGRSPLVRRPRRIRAQYPRGTAEKHVEYILVASFDIDRGSIMEHSYPGPISGDEHMLAELMLPDQAHVRSQDWTIFFLHKDVGEAQEAERQGRARPNGGDTGDDVADKNHAQTNGLEESEESDDDEAERALDGPPLVYVLNLVNTKQDTTAKRGAIVKAMAICTRHSFLHIYKPLLLLAIEEYFKAPVPETLASLYDAINSIDLSLMPRLSILERAVLQASEAKDLFIEKFEQMMKQREASARQDDHVNGTSRSPPAEADRQSLLKLPRDTHEFESRVLYNGVPIPIKVPTATSPEIVSDFSLIKLIQTFSTPHSTSPQPFSASHLHTHLTTSGPLTHPIIVLANALLTQKRVIFLGHNQPSSSVAEAVLASCALASGGGVLKGFIRHAFPYTDLTKIEDLLRVPGFVAGVTNPAFGNKEEWWDLLCDLGTGRMRISSRIEPAEETEGLREWKRQHPSFSFSSTGGATGHPVSGPGQGTADATGDAAFMDDIMRRIASRCGEAVIRSQFRSYVSKFIRIAAAFEESVGGTSALSPNAFLCASPALNGAAGPNGVHAPASSDKGISGHGYVWSSPGARAAEISANVHRVEGWRNTRSYYNFISDLAVLWEAMPIKAVDIEHHCDRLRRCKLGAAGSADIYLALERCVRGDKEMLQLLRFVEEGKGGLFYLGLGLFHPWGRVREASVRLLERIRGDVVGRRFWGTLGRFGMGAFWRIRRERERGREKEGEGGEEDGY